MDYATTVDFRQAWKIVSEMGKIIEKGDFLSVTLEDMEEFEKAMDYLRNHQMQQNFKEVYEK